MQQFTLPFGQIFKHSSTLSEVIIDQGVELDMSMLELYLAYFARYHQSPFCILVNKKFSYSYSWEVQQRICHIPNLVAFAVYCPSKASLMATKVLHDLPINQDVTIKVFSDRHEAMTWLNQNMERPSASGA